MTPTTTGTYGGDFFVWLMFCWTPPVGTLAEIDDGEAERVESTGDKVAEGTGVFAWLLLRWLLPVDTLVGSVGIGNGGPESVEPEPVESGPVELEPVEPGLVGPPGSEAVAGRSPTLSG